MQVNALSNFGCQYTRRKVRGKDAHVWRLPLFSLLSPFCLPFLCLWHCSMEIATDMLRICRGSRDRDGFWYSPSPVYSHRVPLPQVFFLPFLTLLITRETDAILAFSPTRGVNVKKNRLTRWLSSVMLVEPETCLCSQRSLSRVCVRSLFRRVRRLFYFCYIQPH
ncbi:hypothetical protein GGR50DRAFT_25548 [Xylaria sp. CBS 124048]|nr:hypothetical protein GGR50DRAFT_25548 [Xylaria sp. CBS 124048]